MENNKKTQSGGINISGQSVSIGGDLVGHDKISYISNVSTTVLDESLHEWQIQMYNEIDKTNMPLDEKDDVKRQVDTIKTAILEDKGRNPNRLEKLINVLAAMSSDIFEVAIATLNSPLSGIGLAIKKISDKAKVEAHLK